MSATAVAALGDYARTKPAADPYLAAVERFRIEPKQALIIEDSARGLGSALAAGIPCVIVDNELTQGQDFSGAAARGSNRSASFRVCSTDGRQISLTSPGHRHLAGGADAQRAAAH